MFKGLQDALHKSIQEEPPLDPSFALIQTADIILQDEKLQEPLGKFPGLMGLSRADYEKFCQSLLNQFAEFVQGIPETRGGYFSLKGGILEHTFRRTNIALSMLRSYFLPTGDEGADLTTPQTLWAYAIFSAGLLQGIGKILVDVRIDLFNRKQQSQGPWDPFSGSMVGKGIYYRYDFESPYGDEFRHRASLLLARQIMPKEGFDWLASDKDIFSIWLALLEDDVAGGRNLAPILWRADALTVYEHLMDVSILHDPKAFLDQSRVRTTFTGAPLKEGFKNIDVGAHFLAWLKTQIETDSIKLDDGVVSSVPNGGLLISQDAFKIFVRENPSFKNWQAVQTAFSGLGIHQTGNTNEIFQHYLRLNDKTRHVGLIIHKELLLSPEKAALSIGNGFVKITDQSIKNVFIATNGKLSADKPTLYTPERAHGGSFKPFG